MAGTGSASRGRVARSTVHTERSRPIESIIVSIVYFVFGAIAIILGLRFVLKLLGANADAGFVEIVYSLAAPFMAPFEAVFQTQQVEGAVFEWSVLLAIVVYMLLAWGIASLVAAVTPRYSAGTIEESRHTDEAVEAVSDGVAVDEHAHVDDDVYVDETRR